MSRDRNAPTEGRTPTPSSARPTRRWKNPDSKVELMLLALAALSLGAGLAMWALDVERPGRVVEEPSVAATQDCFFDAEEMAVVAPYEVSGSNDGEVWLRVRAKVEGLDGGPSGKEGMLTPDGDYTVQGDVAVAVQGEPDSTEALSCSLTASQWE